LRPCLDELPAIEAMSDIFPFSDEQVLRIAGTEPTLRDMLQQCRHLFDHLVYGPDDAPAPRTTGTVDETDTAETIESRVEVNVADALSPSEASEPLPAVPEFAEVSKPTTTPRFDPDDLADLPLASEIATSRLAAMLEKELAEESPNFAFKSVDIVDLPEDSSPHGEVPLALPVHPEPEPVVASVPTSSAEALPELEDSAEPVAMASAAVAVEVPPSIPFPAPLVATEPPALAVSASIPSSSSLAELWDQEQRAARRKLEPEGALTGATRELQAGLGAFLTICHEHGVKVGPWRIQHVVPEWTFGEHPTYGAVTIAHWACKDGQPWKLGIGLFLARGAGKPKDLEIKLSSMDTEPAVVDYLILLRPEDDLTLTAKSKSLWQEAERRGKHARLEPVSLDGFAQFYSFPRWLSAVRESLPEGAPLPNLAELLQEKCEKLLEQVCMPMHG
jgi:hypothetical protein